MITSKCIFVSRPEECSSCLQSQKLQCLIDHRHLKVSRAGKKEMAEILKQECSNPNRYKEKSGQEGRVV